MKKYVFESLKFFCAAILCTILSAFTSPSWGALPVDIESNNGVIKVSPNLVEFNETRINRATWANADKTKGFEVYADVYGKSVGDSLLTNANSFGVFVPCKQGESISLDFFDYTPLYARCYYCEITADGKCNTTPQEYADYDARIIKQKTFTLTKNDSIGFIIEWWINSQQTRNYTASNYMIVKGSTPPTKYIPYCDGTIVNYVSATGTVVQDGTPTPDNPIDPVFYQQGNMILRAVGDVADSYDATTGKITRRIGVKVFNGTENWREKDTYGRMQIPASEIAQGASMRTVPALCTHFENLHNGESIGSVTSGQFYIASNSLYFHISQATTSDFKTWLADQYANGTPMTVWYPLAEPVQEDWTESQYCNANNKITIATTKYNETKFSPLNTALANAISVVDSVVSNTITQAGRIADLQAQKQTRPADDPSDANNAENCPAGKKCLLVEDASGIPHWYEIVENAWDLPAGYTQLEYIESTGTQYIDTGYTVTSNVVEYGVEIYGGPGNKKSIFGSENKSVDVKYSGIPYVVDGSVGLYAGSTLSPVANVQFPASQWNTYIVSVTSATALNVSLNGAVRNGTYAGGVQNGKPIYLFTNNGDEAQITSQKISNRIRRFYIKDNNSIVRDFVPAQHGSDVGMYDLVSGQFFTNAGDGEFIAGPVAE